MHFFIQYLLLTHTIKENNCNKCKLLEWKRKLMAVTIENLLIKVVVCYYCSFIIWLLDLHHNLQSVDNNFSNIYPEVNSCLSVFDNFLSPKAEK